MAQKKEFNEINGDLLAAIRKGGVIVREARTEHEILVLVKNPKGSEWRFSEFFTGFDVPKFILYASYNFTLLQATKAFYESVRVSKVVSSTYPKP